MTGARGSSFNMFKPPALAEEGNKPPIGAGVAQTAGRTVTPSCSNLITVIVSKFDTEWRHHLVEREAAFCS